MPRGKKNPIETEYCRVRRINRELARAERRLFAALEKKCDDKELDPSPRRVYCEKVYQAVGRFPRRN